MVQLEIQKLTVAYGENRPAVDDVSLTVPAGAARALIGASGAGKSTIGSAALGLLAPSASVRGRVQVDGIEMLGGGPAARAKRGAAIAHLGQTPKAMFNPSRRIGAQVAEAVRLSGCLQRKQVRRFLAARLEEVGLTLAHADAWPHQLSGGQLRRAALAMALATDPMLLVADEPTASLDPVRTQEVILLLKGLRTRRKLGLLLITHDLAVAATLCSSAFVLQQGRIVDAGVWSRLEHPYSASLIAAARAAEIMPLSGQSPTRADGHAAGYE